MCFACGSTCSLTSRAAAKGQAVPSHKDRQACQTLGRSLLSLDVLDAKLVGPARQEFIELRLSGPDTLVLQHLYQPVDRGIGDGHTAPPLSSVMNARRFTASASRASNRKDSTSQHRNRLLRCGISMPSMTARGQNAKNSHMIISCPLYPGSDRRADIRNRQLRATSGCEQPAAKQSRYSITSSARASNVGGTVKRRGGLEVGHELGWLTIYE